MNTCILIKFPYNVQHCPKKGKTRSFRIHFPFFPRCSRTKKDRLGPWLCYYVCGKQHSGKYLLLQKQWYKLFPIDCVSSTYIGCGIEQFFIIGFSKTL